MAFKKGRGGWWYNVHAPEEPKAHDELPDSLGLGIKEELVPDKGLYIWLEPREVPSSSYAFHPYIVLGKYEYTQADGSQFYVANWTLKGLNVPVSKHEHMLMAISAIYEIIETYEQED